MNKITVVAKVIAKKEHAEAVRQELLKLVAPTRQEDGCIEYNLHQDNRDSDVFMFYETWLNRASLDRHMQSDHFKTYIETVDGMIVDKEVNILTRIE